MKNLTKFTTTEAFEEATLNTPNVSVTMDNNKVHYVANQRDINKTINIGKFATLYADAAVKAVTEGVKLYIITNAPYGQEFETTEMSIIPAYTPMLIENTGSTTNVVLHKVYDRGITPVEYAEEYKGTLTGKQITSADMQEYEYYILTSDGKFRFVGEPGTIGAGKCWVQYPKN